MAGGFGSRIFHVAADFLAVLVFSMTVGAGVGVIQGHFAFLGTDLWPDILWETSMVGAACGLPLGPILHYLVLGRRTTFEALLRITTLTVLFGSGSALILNKATGGEGGWLSMLVSIPACVGLAIWQRCRVSPA